MIGDSNEDIGYYRDSIRVYGKVTLVGLFLCMIIVFITSTIDLFRISKGARKRVFFKF